MANGSPGTIATEESDGADFLVVNGAKIQVFHKKEPGAEYLCDSTGVFTHNVKVELHLANCAQKVVISAPLKDAAPIYVVGFKHKDYKVSDTVCRMPLAQPVALRPSPRLCTTSSASLKAS